MTLWHIWATLRVMGSGRRAGAHAVLALASGLLVFAGSPGFAQGGPRGFAVMLVLAAALTPLWRGTIWSEGRPLPLPLPRGGRAVAETAALTLTSGLVTAAFTVALAVSAGSSSLAWSTGRLAAAGLGAYAVLAVAAQAMPARRPGALTWVVTAPVALIGVVVLVVLVGQGWALDGPVVPGVLFVSVSAVGSGLLIAGARLVRARERVDSARSRPGRPPLAALRADTLAELRPQVATGAAIWLVAWGLLFGGHALLPPGPEPAWATAALGLGVLPLATRLLGAATPLGLHPDRGGREAAWTLLPIPRATVQRALALHILTVLALGLALDTAALLLLGDGEGLPELIPVILRMSLVGTAVSVPVLLGNAVGLRSRSALAMLGLAALAGVAPALAGGDALAVLMGAVGPIALGALAVWSETRGQAQRA